MLRTHYSTELKPQENVKVAGWMQDRRDMGSLMFVVLRDFMGTVQITIKKNAVDPALFEKFSKLPKESVIVVEGDCVTNGKAPGGVEILPKSLAVLSESDPVLPIDLFSKEIKTGFDKRLDFRSIDLRRPENLAVFKIQSILMQEIQAFFRRQKFMQVFTPSLMGASSEGGSELFSVLYFKREAFLRQDPQLHRQLSILGGLEKIYEIGPSWRAELSHTTRHLCEHRTCVAEIAFIKDEYDVMELEQNMVIAAIESLKKDCAGELERLNVDFAVPKKFPVLEFPKIYDVLEKMGVKIPFGDDYGTEGEKALGKYIKEKYKSDFFFVNRFPFAHKPFYVMRYDDDPQWARSTDLLHSSGVELSSGGQREHRYDKIMEQVKIKGVTPSSVSWFTEFFKYGAPPHGGFSFGIERICMVLLGLPNIREAVLFPRDPERLTP